MKNQLGQFKYFERMLPSQKKKAPNNAYIMKKIIKYWRIF